MCTREQFCQVFDKILATEIEDIRNNYTLPETAVNWVQQLHQHAIPGGKMNRGLTVVASLQSILGRDLSEDELFLSQVLGWCIEWVNNNQLRLFELLLNDITFSYKDSFW